MTGITEKLADLRGRIARSEARAARPAGSVTIVAVTKTHPVETVRAALAAGLTDFGENYVQEAVAKIDGLNADATWHFIGRLQANKTRPVAEQFRWAQTVTSAQLAERLSRQRPFYGGDLQVCVQVAPLLATGRSGVPAAEVPELAARIASLPRLKLRGLMFMPLPDLGEAALRAEFRRVRELLATLREAGHHVDTLSMGMSEDLEIAVEEGSTMVRIGTALFGARN